MCYWQLTTVLSCLYFFPTSILCFTPVCHDCVAFFLKAVINAKIICTASTYFFYMNGDIICELQLPENTIPACTVITTYLHSIQDTKTILLTTGDFFKPEQQRPTGLARTKTQLPQQLYSAFVSWFHFVFVLLTFIWLQVCPFSAAPHHQPSLSLSLLTLLTLFLLRTCTLCRGPWQRDTNKSSASYLGGRCECWWNS